LIVKNLTIKHYLEHIKTAPPGFSLVSFLPGAKKDTASIPCASLGFACFMRFQPQCKIEQRNERYLAPCAGEVHITPVLSAGVPVFLRAQQKNENPDTA
jgi:hypothetical protein